MRLLLQFLYLYRQFLPHTPHRLSLFPKEGMRLRQGGRGGAHAAHAVAADASAEWPEADAAPVELLDVEPPALTVSCEPSSPGAPCAPCTEADMVRHASLCARAHRLPATHLYERGGCRTNPTAA